MRVAAQLAVSLSGLSDNSTGALARGARFTAALDGRGAPVSHLYRPGSPREKSPLAAWLLQRAAAGDALVLHGYDHTPDPTGARTGLNRRAEFAALPRHEAGLRLTAARRALTAAGLRTDVFVPPRWIASAGTVEALREQGFAVLADEVGVHALQGDGGVVRARVLGFRATGLADDGKAAEAWRCRLLVAEVARTVRRGGLVRINVRSKDLKRPARRDAVLAAVDTALAEGALPVTYVRTPATPTAAA